MTKKISKICFNETFIYLALTVFDYQSQTSQEKVCKLYFYSSIHNWFFFFWVEDFRGVSMKSTTYKRQTDWHVFVTILFFIFLFLIAQSCFFNLLCVNRLVFLSMIFKYWYKPNPQVNFKVDRETKQCFLSY